MCVCVCVLYLHATSCYCELCGVLKGKWDVPLPKVRGMSEAEVFKVVKTGKSRRTLCLFVTA